MSSKYVVVKPSGEVCASCNYHSCEHCRRAEIGTLYSHFWKNRQELAYVKFNGANPTYIPYERVMRYL